MKQSLLITALGRPWPGQQKMYTKKIGEKLLLLVPILVLTLAIFSNPAWASPPQVVVEVIPDKVELPSNGEVQVLVVVRNLSAHRLEDIHLSWFTDTCVSITSEPTAPNYLEPQGTFAWTMVLSGPEKFPVSGLIHIRVDYSWEADDKSDAIPGLAFGTLEINSPVPEPPERIVDVQIQTTVGALNEQQPGEVYLIIKNVSNTVVCVKDVLPNGPDFIAFPDIELEKVTLTPGQSRVIPVVVKAKDVVRPGNYLLLFDVRLEWERTGRSRTGNLIVSREVEVGVLGESEILKTLAVPSFLLLPGFLMIITAGLLWKLGQATREFPLRVSNPEFWLVAITLSILMAGIYPIATKHLMGIRRNYLEGYGLIDVVYVWMSSILLAALTYIVAIGIRNLVKRTSQWVRSVNQQRRAPSEADDPVTLLKKLHRQNLGVYLERVELKIKGANHFAFVFEAHGEDWETLWVGPAIVVEWLEGVDVKLRMQVDKQLGEKGSAATLAALLERGHKEGYLRVTWKQMGQLTKPYLAKKADILSFEPPNVFIEQE